MKIFLSLIFLFIALTGFCAKKSITLLVSDPFTEINIEKVAVYSESDELLGFTNSSGELEIQNIVKNSKIRFFHMNYVDTIITLRSTKGIVLIKLQLMDDLKKQILEKENINYKSIYAEVEESPDSSAYFRTKDFSEMFKFINMKIDYPQYAIENGIIGKVYLAFIIEADGSVTNISVLKGVSRSIDRAAVEVVEKFPKWVPAIKDGAAIRSLMGLPINFTLE